MVDRVLLDDVGINYPRKQLRRDQWMSLNGPWSFTFDREQKFRFPGDVMSWPLTIEVPFAPEAKASGIGDMNYHPRCWYQKKFKYPIPAGKRVILHFGAVDYQAKVWMNGQFLGEHEGGFTPFSFDVTESLRVDGEQVLTVCADDDPLDLTKPRGKQDWQLDPHSIWYPRTTGIWQSVWLENVSPTHIEKIRCTPQIERWELDCQVFVKGICLKNTQLSIRLTCDGKLLAHDRYEVIHNEVHRRIALSDPGIDDFRNELLWSPEKPTLLDIELELWRGDQLIDHVRSYSALRSASIQRGRFLLNGRPYYMRLVLDQGYWPDTLMTAPSSEALKKDIEIAKAAGFNGARKHQKIEDADFLYWADVLGFLVWTEMPSAYRFSHESVERLMKEWTEVIDRDMNHPSVVVWVPFNESWGVPDLSEKEPHQHCVQAMYHLTKTLDPTRPCIGNDGWESTATDILGIHDYDDQPERLIKKYAAVEVRPNTEMLSRYWPGGRMLTVEGYTHSHQPIMLTEFGGIAWLDPEHPAQGKAWGYSACSTPKEFRDRYEKLLAAVHLVESFSGFCYTQLTDTFQESNGLYRADRTPKFSVNAMARATRGAGFTRGELTSAPPPPPIAPEDEVNV